MAAAAILVLGALLALAFLLAQAQEDARESVKGRFTERAQISATLTQSVFSALGGASGKDLQRRYGGAKEGLSERLARQLPQSRAPYMAVVDAQGRMLGSAGRPPRRLALAGASPETPALSDIVGSGDARVIEYSIPFGSRGNRRALVQAVPLTLMSSFLDDYLLRLHEVDGAGLALTDSNGAVLTRKGKVATSGSGATSRDRLATSAGVPGTPWKLRLEAPKAQVLASVSHLHWLAWLLLAALAVAAVTGILLLRRVIASARRQRAANVALHESRQQLRNLVEALEEGVALHHADGSTELLNASARQLVETEDDVLGALPPDWELLDEMGAPLDRDDTPARQALLTGRACTKVVALKRPGGGPRWLKVRARPLVRPDEDRPYAVVASFTDVTEQRETELHLTELAQREPLTGLWNRRRFEEDLARQLARCRRYDERAALVLVDIDHFKQINDTLGHLAGDDVLRALADGLRQMLRASDSAARIGGDEFAVVLLGLEEPEARSMADDVAARLTAFVHDDLDSHVELSLSIGVTMLDGATQGVDEAFAAADHAMYEHKRRRAAMTAPVETSLADAIAPANGAGRPTPHLASLRALVTAVQARDSYTAGHSRQVVTLSRAVARRLGLSEDETADVEGAALLHDLGKIAVPDAILRKRGPLNDHEWVLMRQHPVVGAQMVASIAELEHLAPAVRAEHERWDGCGYPDGLAGEEIPLASRITFVCDAYHAMTSERPYRRALSHEEAVREIERGLRRQFCPSAGGALLEVLRAQVAVRAAEAADAA